MLNLHSKKGPQKLDVTRKGRFVLHDSSRLTIGRFDHPKGSQPAKTTLQPKHERGNAVTIQSFLVFMHGMDA
jgi:hypothetical protein